MDRQGSCSEPDLLDLRLYTDYLREPIRPVPNRTRTRHRDPIDPCRDRQVALRGTGRRRRRQRFEPSSTQPINEQHDPTERLPSAATGRHPSTPTTAAAAGASRRGTCGCRERSTGPAASATNIPDGCADQHALARPTDFVLERTPTPTASAAATAWRRGTTTATASAPTAPATVADEPGLCTPTTAPASIVPSVSTARSEPAAPWAAAERPRRRAPRRTRRPAEWTRGREREGRAEEHAGAGSGPLSSVCVAGEGGRPAMRRGDRRHTRSKASRSFTTTNDLRIRRPAPLALTNPNTLHDPHISTTVASILNRHRSTTARSPASCGLTRTHRLSDHFPKAKSVQVRREGHLGFFDCDWISTLYFPSFRIGQRQPFLCRQSGRRITAFRRLLEWKRCQGAYNVTTRRGALEIGLEG